MGDFKLSAVLTGHSSDVRAVAFPSLDLAVTASRDGTTKTWKRASAAPPDYACTESSHGSAYKTCVAYMRATKDFPQGLIISGGQDTIIEARQPGSTAESNADGLMIGHSHQVSSLDVNAEEGWIVSGSWDGTARLWRVGSWEPEVEFPGHEGTVWAVLAYSSQIVVTGCADKGIRVFDTQAKVVAKFSVKNVCRALAKIPEGHSTGGQLLSASNDSVIRVWDLKGGLISELHGHEAFIYSLAVLPNGNFVSSGEDRTVRVWQDTSCIQTITIPAVSVWSVATCGAGDIIAGSSDKVARIFTRTSDRMADPTVQAEFDEAIKSSSIPEQTVGALNKTDMKGPDFLQQKSGTKDGQIQMIKEGDGSVSAYSWSMAKQIWDMVGTVVDSASGSQKVNYRGKQYDYVFDVDIEDGKPPLKLPFNVSQNPHDVAMSWLQDNGLPLTYLDEMVNFIRKNTQGVTLGEASSSAPGPDPLGIESRYRPDDGPSQQATRPTPVSPKKLPQKEYISIVAGKPAATYQQILKLNTQYTEASNTGHLLSESELDTLDQISKQLQIHQFDSQKPLPQTPPLQPSMLFAVRISTQWQPPTNRLAGLDFLRFLAAATPQLSELQVEDADIVTIVASSGVFDHSLVTTNTKLAMVAIRLFDNLMFASQAGRNLLEVHSDLVLGHIKNMTPYCHKDPSLSIAVTTYHLNLAVWLTRPENSHLPSREDRALTIVESVSQILESLPPLEQPSRATKSTTPTTPTTTAAQQQATEPVFRGLFAIGTVLVRSSSPSELKDAARNIFNIGALLSKLDQRGYLKEGRFRGLVEEVEMALK